MELRLPCLILDFADHQLSFLLVLAVVDVILVHQPPGLLLLVSVPDVQHKDIFPAYLLAIDFTR